MDKKNKLFEEKQFVAKNIFALPVPPAEIGQRLPSLFHLKTFNFFLLVFMGIFGIWYALWSNLVISDQYRERLVKDRLESLGQENNQLLSKKSDFASLGALMVFAKQSGLVEQKNIEYIFDRNNVARK